MADLIDYVLWRGDLSFHYAPFNTVDALVLCQISYINFGNNLVSESFTKTKTIAELNEDFRNSPDFPVLSNLGMLINPKTVDLLDYCAKSVRFRDIEVCGYRRIFDAQAEEQFAAITYAYNRIKFIAYQGTDDTLIGWKEDFNMGYLKEVPAQRDAVKYFVDASSVLPGKFMLAGHSKGGNLAMYAATMCGARRQGRIKSIYNFDGPGFWPEVFDSPQCQNIQDKIISVYPELCVVGMIFKHPKKFTITESNEFAIMQHDPFSWGILGTGFVEVPDFKEESKFFYATFNHWAAELSPEQTKDFVNTLFDVIMSTGATSNSEIDENKIQNSAKMVHAMAQIDRKKRQQMVDIMQMFLKVGKGNIPMFNLFRTPKLLEI